MFEKKCVICGKTFLSKRKIVQTCGLKKCINEKNKQQNKIFFTKFEKELQNEINSIRMINDKLDTNKNDYQKIIENVKKII